MMCKETACLMGLAIGVVIGGCIVYKSKTVRELIAAKERISKTAMEDFKEIAVKKVDQARTKIADGIEMTGEKIADAIEPSKKPTQKK